MNLIADWAALDYAWSWCDHQACHSTSWAGCDLLQRHFGIPDWDLSIFDHSTRLPVNLPPVWCQPLLGVNSMQLPRCSVCVESWCRFTILFSHAIAVSSNRMSCLLCTYWFIPELITSFSPDIVTLNKINMCMISE